LGICPTSMPLHNHTTSTVETVTLGLLVVFVIVHQKS
jgi:hypothetical protein